MASPVSCDYYIFPSKLLHLTSFSASPSSSFLLPRPLKRSFRLLVKSSQRSVNDLVSPKTPSSSSLKSYIWVNPNSPRASELRKQSHHFRYFSLVDIAHSLDSCDDTIEDVSRVLFALGDNVVEQDAVIVLNSMKSPNTALLALHFFQKKLKLIRELVLYNVTFKVLRKNRDLDRAEKLFDEMLLRGVKPDNVTFSTIISSFRMCNLPHRAVEWLEKMPAFGCSPDDVTYSAMIDAYGRAGNVARALALYDRARTERWLIDAVTFSTLIRIYGKTGNFVGCLNVYEEMKALGVKPNLVIYNTLLDAMGRAKRPWQAKNIYKEMTNCGVSPSWELMLLFCWPFAEHVMVMMPSRSTKK